MEMARTSIELGCNAKESSEMGKLIEGKEEVSIPYRRDFSRDCGAMLSDYFKH